jgi:hypothetical protein
MANLERHRMIAWCWTTWSVPPEDTWRAMAPSAVNNHQAMREAKMAITRLHSPKLA